MYDLQERDGQEMQEHDEAPQGRSDEPAVDEDQMEDIGQEYDPSHQDFNEPAPPALNEESNSYDEDLHHVQGGLPLCPGRSQLNDGVH